MSVLYEVEPKVYLDRQRRAMHANGMADGTVRLDEMRTLLAEVPPLDALLTFRRRYRVRVLAGPPVMKHWHGQTTGGQTIGVDLPTVAEPEWQDIEGTYLGRGSGPWSGSHVFQVASAQVAMVADIDVMRLEEVA